MGCALLLAIVVLAQPWGRASAEAPAQSARGFAPELAERACLLLTADMVARVAGVEPASVRLMDLQAQHGVTTECAYTWGDPLRQVAKIHSLAVHPSAEDARSALAEAAAVEGPQQLMRPVEGIGASAYRNDAHWVRHTKSEHGEASTVANELWVQTGNLSFRVAFRDGRLDQAYAEPLAELARAVVAAVRADGSAETPERAAAAEPQRQCASHDDCVPYLDSCCPPCLEAPQGAYRVGGPEELAAHEAVCARKDIQCAKCALGTGKNPNFVALCAQNVCRLVDLQREVPSSCEVDSDCVLRAATCCGCSGEPIAIATAQTDAVRALLCSEDMTCEPCGPAPGAAVKAVCKDRRCATEGRGTGQGP